MNEQIDTTHKQGTKRRGFASMTLERRKEVASMGGRSATVRGTRNTFTRESAANAGALGRAARKANAMKKVGS